MEMGIFKSNTVTTEKRKINSNTFLLMITILLFLAMYISGMIIFKDNGFAKPQMFLDLLISNAGLLVIAVGQTIVMITHNEEIAQLADRIIRIEDGRILTADRREYNVSCEK